MNLRSEALSYAALGWRVFPVGADGRSPMLEHGCHDASANPDVVAAWWSRWPMANIALACGPASGVLALDVDSKAEVDGFARLAELQGEFSALPETVCARTPSGGAHLLFAFPAGHNPQNRVGIKRWSATGERIVYAGLDVRAHGASICLAPSRKLNGPYRWERCPQFHDLAPVPDWLLRLMLSEPPPREVRPLSVNGSPDRLARYVCAAVNGECTELAAMRPGSGRNQRLFIAAARLGELVGAGLLAQDDAEAALERASADCGLLGEDGLHSIRATVASGLRRGIANPREVAA